MATGYGGTYRASVVDNVDPMMQSRLQVVVPEVTGTDATWATPAMAPGSTDLPNVGDDVFVSFEHGDSDYPVWQTNGEEAPSGGRGYVGTYRGIVVDAVDPLEAGRLLVNVPEVFGSESAWATRSTALSDDTVGPDAGAEVWVEFESGDPDYPVWIGVP